MPLTATDWTLASMSVLDALQLEVIGLHGEELEGPALHPHEGGGDLVVGGGGVDLKAQFGRGDALQPKARHRGDAPDLVHETLDLRQPLDADDHGLHRPALLEPR